MLKGVETRPDGGDLVRVAEDVQRLQEGIEVLGAGKNGHPGPVACDLEPLVSRDGGLDQTREVGTRFGEGEGRHVHNSSATCFRLDVQREVEVGELG